MDERNQQIDADRLCDAASAVMKAVREMMVAIENGQRSAVPYPPDLMGSPQQPQCLAEYSRFEVEEATLFLIRLGMLEQRSGPA